MIVSPNDLIFCICLYIWMAKKFAKGSFHFPSAESRVFCEWSTKYLMSIWTNPFFYYTRPYFINNLQKFPCKMFLMHLCWKRQIAANSDGTGWNLNYKCLIVCSLFFQKIISKCKVIISSEIYKEFCRIPHLAITGHAPLPRFDRSLKSVLKQFKKNQKNIKPSRCILICVLVTIKSNNLGIMQIY